MASTEPIAGRCAAKVSVSERNPNGGYCELPPMAGQTRCGSHGGRAPQAKAAAERRQQETAAAVYVARYGMPTEIEWHEAIQAGLNETYGNVLALRDLVLQLQPAALTWGEQQVVTVGSSQFPGVDITQAAGIAPVVALYGQERDRLHRMAVDAGKLGLEARKQEFAEDQALKVVEVLRGALLELTALLASGRITTVDPADPVVAGVVSSRLRALSGGAP